MKRQQWILWGAALFSAAIGSHVSIGLEVPPVPKKDGIAAAANEKTAANENTKSKRAKDVDANQDANSGSPKSSDPQVSIKRSPDEEAIRLTGEAYVKSYCAADAKSIAALFTMDAEYIDEQGDTYSGREDIEEAMKVLFAENVGCRIALDIETIRSNRRS